MVTPGVLRPDLRALPQLGQPDQLLVQPSVLLDLVASPRYLHFDSVFLLLLGKMPLSTCKFTSITINYLEEVVFVILVVAAIIGALCYNHYQNKKKNHVRRINSNNEVQRQGE